MSNMKSLIVLSFLATTVTGCLGITGLGTERLQRFASGAVPCSPGDINVENESTNDGWPATWTAFCGGEKYFCSVAAVGTATCAKEHPAPTAAKK